ncbi:MAG TPA: SAM-dependent methyltransferase [Dongiaceae bacterium]|nr:SAM-dependent methyltransferase [Dongiaceae bacterium]
MTPLARLLLRRIALTGPITVAEFMAEALGHPLHGYYQRRDPLGRAGDFITAPEVSQMFGELIGLWCVEVWHEMGCPDPCHMVELGPGRGTLMADALRAARVRPAFGAAIRLHLVETSPYLRERQAQALPAHHPQWHASLAEVPEGPLLLVANEFFDALPAHEFELRPEGWRERVVACDGEQLTFAWAEPGPSFALLTDRQRRGAKAEVCPVALSLAGDIGRRLAQAGGAALIVDYGSSQTLPGESLQAVRRHEPVNPLSDIGEADLSAHVDFAGLARAAEEAGAVAHGPLPQGEFLLRLGLEARAESLLARATPAQARDIDSARRRLLDSREMGTLFKALALVAPGLAPPPGFAEAP